jgi:hypothetical protein
MGAIQDLTASFSLLFTIGGISFIVSALLHCLLTFPATNVNDDKGHNTRRNAP